MSCSGCRVLRKGCSDICVLRPSISWIDGPEAQGHATVFVAKFFGRANLLSSLSAVHEVHRPALFRSLLYEACGRTVNPITGIVGLLWRDNWDACEASVDTILRGGIPQPMMKLNFCTDVTNELYELNVPSEKERKRSATACDDLSLCLKRRALTPSDESVMTSEENDGDDQFRFKEQPKLLNLFF